MAARSLNKVQLIGNLTRDPELRYTPTGAAVCTFGLATNRQWATDSGEKKEDVEFHKIVAWNKLAEICSQLLSKGRRVYIEGRLSTRSWQGQDGQTRQTTEIVASDMIILDSKGFGDVPVGPTEVIDVPDETALPPADKEVEEIVSQEVAPTVADEEKGGKRGKKDLSAQADQKPQVDQGDEMPF